MNEESVIGARFVSNNASSIGNRTCIVKLLKNIFEKYANHIAFAVIL